MDDSDKLFGDSDTNLLDDDEILGFPNNVAGS